MIFVVFADVVPQFLAEESSICLAHNLQHSSQPIDFRLYFGQLVHKASGMERHTCLMIFIFIIYCGFLIICGGYIIIRGGFFSIFGT